MENTSIEWFSQPSNLYTTNQIGYAEQPGHWKGGALILQLFATPTHAATVVGMHTRMEDEQFWSTRSCA